MILGNSVVISSMFRKKLPFCDIFCSMIKYKSIIDVSLSVKIVKEKNRFFLNTADNLTGNMGTRFLKSYSLMVFLCMFGLKTIVLLRN